MIPVTYRGGQTGTVIHLASEMFTECAVALRAFADEDEKFPHYSTGNQFLSDTQFSNLVKFGRELCDAALGDRDVTRTIVDAVRDDYP